MVLTFALCHMATKWNGALKIDVPLTTYFVATFYFLLRATIDLKEDSVASHDASNYRYFFFAAPTFALGVWTKGPIIGALAGAFLIWTLLESKWKIWRQKTLWLAIALALLILSVPLLPMLRFPDGLDMYTKFVEFKSGYLKEGSSKFGGPFFYLIELVVYSPQVLIAIVLSLPLIFRSNPDLSSEARSFTRLAIIIFLWILIPLSFFQTKFHHYLLPGYPFLAIAMTPIVYKASNWMKTNLETWIWRLSFVALLVLVTLPIKTAGGRQKRVLNITNLIKFESSIKQRGVYFLGNYYDDMSIFQTMKFYSGIDLRPLNESNLSRVNLDKDFVIIPVSKLDSLKSLGFEKQDCLILNQQHCLWTKAKTLQFSLPDKVYPHEVY